MAKDIKEEDRLMTVEKAAEMLGFSEDTIRNWIFYRKIDVVRILGSVRIRKSVVDSMITLGTVPKKGSESEYPRPGMRGQKKVS